MLIRISTPKTEGILQVSKWLKFQVLLDADEMHELLSWLDPVQFVCVSEPVKVEEAVISAPCFEEKYAAYISCLKQGEPPVLSAYRRYFSSAMSADLGPFYALAAGPEKYLIKPVQPIIQLQAHAFFYSELDGKFHPMVLSEESVMWGLQFSYPQLYQDLKTRKICKVSDIANYPNNVLFSKLSKWMRSATLPTPFEVGGVRTNSPIRIGKKTLPWIKNHPQLKRKGITVLQLARA